MHMSKRRKKEPTAELTLEDINEMLGKQVVSIQAKTIAITTSIFLALALIGFLVVLLVMFGLINLFT